jgi:outer membrane protein assembly factor BamE (lipoprotein component of BamABCDE complex)
MKKSIVIAFAAALVAGCATHGQSQPWWTLNERSFAGIAPGKTSKEDVERQVGTPLLAMAFRNLDEDVWDYRYLYGTYTYVAEVHFDGSGRTKYIATYPDRCSLRAVPCR